MGPRFKKDTLYSKSMRSIVDFSFDQKTVSVFPDMINRSVPGYSLMQSLAGLVAAENVMQGSRVYDLGCSLGASSLAVLNSVEHDDYELILVDQSKPMIEQCRASLENKSQQVACTFIEQDIRRVEIKNASFVLLNLVLQFLPVSDRQACINSIYEGLLSHGVLLISEKIIAQTEDETDTVDQLFMNFKKRSGYSDLEISQKRQALENVMQPETVDDHKKRLMDAGFSKVIVLMQALNFVTLLAVK